MQRVALLQHDLPQLEGSFPYFKLREYRRFCLNVKATRFQVAEVRREVEVGSLGSLYYSAVPSFFP
jgi:hypothetical protein